MSFFFFCVSHAGWGRGCDILIFYSPDAEEWCQYLQDLFVSCRQVRSQKTQTYRLVPDASFSAQDLWVFRDARCVLVLLSAGLVGCFGQPGLLPMLQRACHPPQRVVRLLCGVQPGDEDFQAFFPDWAHWQEMTCDDEPETYLAAVRKAISEGKGSNKAERSEFKRNYRATFWIRAKYFYLNIGHRAIKLRKLFGKIWCPPRL